MRRSPQKEGGFLGKAGREGAFPGGGIESASRRSRCVGRSRQSRGWSARTRRGEATCRREGVGESPLMLERTAGPPAGAFGLRPGLTLRKRSEGPAPRATSRRRTAGRLRPDRLSRNGFARGLRPLQGSGGSGIGVRSDARSRKGLERMLRHRGERSCGWIGRGSLRSWRAAKGPEGAGFAPRFEGPAAGSIGVRLDRGEPRRGLRVRGSLRGSKVLRCTVSGFASMPGSRRRSLRRARSPRGRQAVRIGRFASGSDRPRGTREISVFCGTRGRWRGEGFALVRDRPLRSEAARASGSSELRKRDLGIQASALPASRREPPRPSRPGRDPRGPESGVRAAPVPTHPAGDGPAEAWRS